MDLSLERDGSVLGSLFNQIITDMKNTSPLWEDFIGKAGKLHACLRAAIQAIAAYLDAFQKIADAATNSRGATKEIGTALTRVCLRHKAVETRLKTFTTAIMDCLVLPLQDKLEDWKRSVATIDKEHAKEHKRCRAELKKRSSDTLRLQKKARKGQSETIQSLVDSHLQDVTQRRAELEEVEKRSLRSAMIEERLRYCSFVHMLQPVVKEECEVISELGHLQEAMQSIALVTKEPSVLPPASEELILDVKSAMCLYSESPCGSGSQGGCSNSLGSRKSSVCSISSMNSSGSSGSPGHHQYQRSLSQFVSPAIRLKAGESSDSGFCSSPALTTQVSAATSQSHAVATWPPHSQDGVATPTADRPHTISTAYEKGHQRPPLTVYTFQNPETIMESCGTNVGSEQSTPSAQKQSGAGGAMSRPPLPVRCSSLERPLSANSNRNGVGALAQRQCPSPLPAHITKELSTHHAQQQQQQQLQMQSAPTYVNMSELASMATMKIAKQQQQQQLVLQQQPSTDSHSSISSNISNDSVSNSHQNHNNSATMTANTNTSQLSTASSSSLHSHPSIDSAVATSFVAQTPTPSSGCSTPQNHYSPLLTNSPSSTAAGTPSGGSVGHGASVFNVSSPTTEQSATGNCTPSSTQGSTQGSVAADLLEITQTDSSKNISLSCNEASTSINNTDSSTIIENDERSRASVLQKASMFEKQAAAISKGSPSPSHAAVARNNNAIEIMGGSNHGLRRIDDYRVPTPVQQQQTEYAAHDRDIDRSFEDSIQELNNLIGELDSFQREIDDSKSHRGSTSSEMSEEQHGTNTTTTTTTTTTLKAVVSTAATLSQAATTLHTYQQEHQRQSTQKHTETRAVNCCPSSNQSNSNSSGGCGADISDATPDKVDALTADNNSIGGVNYIKGSGSEMASHCYRSESNSLIDSDGYENPTFAHLAGSHSMLTAADGMSQVSETYTSSSHEQQAFRNSDDSSSAVVVIYDHQIPITPDIDYVKKNSEIVVLRTKDPQQLHYHQQHEMRQLQHLPTNLSALTDGDGLGHDGHVIPATATVAPANQRLSSFRASTEQQLQILTGCNSISQKQQQQQQKGTHRLSTDSKNSLKLSAATATLPSAPETLTLANGLMRRKLPPKPNFSVFNSSNGKIEASNSKNNWLPQHRPQQLPVAIKADFKADLNAKIRKQQEKCLQKEHHEQQQQQQQQLPQSLPITNNCNTNKYRSALPLPSPLPTTTAPSATSSTSPPANDSIFSVAPSSFSSLTITSSINSLPSTLSQQEHSHFTIHNDLQNHFHSPPAATQAATTSPIPASVAVTALNFPYACASGAVPTASHSSSSATATVSASSSSFSSTVTCAASASLAKPNISPRPASLSGGNTRIARRSSINTNKPSPPVRRSSSVTPSPNSNSGKRPGDASVAAATSNLLYPKHNALNKSVENLPPPPAFLLVEQSPAQCNVMPTSPSHPANVIPLSALKVAETVKALRYQQPLSPVALQRSALVTNRNTYDSSLVSRNSASPSTLNYEKYYKCYVDGNQSSHITSSPHTPPAATTHHSSSVSLPSSPSPPPPPPSIAQVQATGPPPPLPPQNPNRHLHNRQHRHHQQNQAQQHSIYSNSCQSHNVPGDQSSLRTSSPGIYAQPKLVSTMSSFRTSSPSSSSSSNGGHQQHPVQVPLPPTQPKANPNLIAQLNARINKQQQGIVSDQTSVGSALTSTHHQQSHETVYMRNCASQQQQQQHHHQQEAQQQHNYDGKSTTASNNRIYGSFSTCSTSTNSTTNFHHNSSPHFPLSSSTSSLLSKVTSFSSTKSSPSSAAAAFNYQHNHQQTNVQSAAHLNVSQQNVAAAPSNRMQAAAASASSHQQQPSNYHPHHLYNRENYITCPPPLEDPPPPPPPTALLPNPKYAGSSATMPKNCSHSAAVAAAAVGAGAQNLAAYTSATASASATLPKNLQQHRLLYQQLYQKQQQAIDATASVSVSNTSLYPQATSNSSNHRPQMPLPQQQQPFKQKPAVIAGSSSYKQPPIPARHSSVQQKIYVTTNPFIQTTAVHCGSVAAGSPNSGVNYSSSAAGESIYRACGVAHMHPLQQQQQQQHHAIQQHYILPETHYGHNSMSVAAATINTNHVTSTNLDKANVVVGCSSMRSKTKAEFLENLNAKLAKQGISGRAFAVRNLINSKALPDPRLCHESLMDQIKRGATLKRNQKINDRSAPKIH